MVEIKSYCDVCGVDCTDEKVIAKVQWGNILDETHTYDICLPCKKKIKQAAPPPENSYEKKDKSFFKSLLRFIAQSK